MAVLNNINNNNKCVWFTWRFGHPDNAETHLSASHSVPGGACCWYTRWRCPHAFAAPREY